MHVTIPYSSGTVETVIIDKEQVVVPVPVYPSSGEITNPGEIAISTLDGYESICIKSDQNENVLFSDDAANQLKLSSWHNSTNGGLALAQNNKNGPVLSLSEGVPLANQAIIELEHNKRTTLYLTGYEGKVDESGYSPTPFKDSEPCAVYNYQTNLPDNLNEMKDIRFNIKPEGSNATYELTIDNGTDIKTVPNVDHVFLCDCVHGLENVEPVNDHILDISGYCIKQKFVSDITASFANSGETGCRAVASHAEGSNSSTFAVGSHAEGYNTSSHGEFSHSEGFESNTSGLCSSAHNGQTSTDSAATGSSVYGYQNAVLNLGEFACGTNNGYNLLEGWLLSVGDGMCINQGDTTPTIQASLCPPHSIFKILFDERDAYYYPLFDLSSAITGNSITRNLVITATIGNDKLTKTLYEWYDYITNGGR
jgi:hypothetical protein